MSEMYILELKQGISYSNLYILEIIGSLFFTIYHFAINAGVITIKKFDKEYQTNWVTEQIYLSDCGIRYEFVKNINGVTTYKYKKTAKLFKCLTCFYEKLGILE